MRLFSLLLLLGCKTVDHRLDPGGLEVSEPRAPEGVSAEARGWALKARVAEETGDLDEAERALGWVLRLEREEPASWVLWGRYLERQRQSTQAVDAYEQALVRDPEHARAHLHLGDLYVRGERFDEATLHLERAAESGEAPESFGVLARLYERMDRPDALSELVSRWLQQPEPSVDERLLRAQSALVAGQASAAVDDLVVVLERRDDPLLGELLIEASVRACRLGTAANTVRRLGLDEDEAYMTTMARLDRELEKPCDAAAHVRQAKSLPACDSLPSWLLAFDANPAHPGVEVGLSQARLACETARSSEDP